MRNDKVYFVFDDPGDRDKMKILLDYETREYKQIYPKNKLRTPKQMLSFVNSFLENTYDSDTIVFWYDFMGILCYWICKLKRINRKIIILNILLKNKTTKKNKLAKFLYRSVLKDESVVSTVTSAEYGEWLNDLLRIKRHHYLLHDIYYGDAILKTECRDNVVFCGGRNGRDWDKVIEIANKMSDVCFNCVMPSSIWNEKGKFFPSNAVVKYDIPESEFLYILQKSKFMLMPLDTESPAGLVAIFQAGMYKKMVITSNTVTTREYITSDRGALCSDSIDDWVETINFYLNNEGETVKKAENFNRFLNDICSAKVYTSQLFKLVEESRNG